MFIGRLKGFLPVFSLFLHGRKASCIPFEVQIMSKRKRDQRYYSVTKHPRRTMADDSNSDAHSRQRNLSSRSANIKEINGVLFTCPDDHSLAHCISADVKMNKGNAVMFKQLFGGFKELHDQRQWPGGLAVLYRDQRFIYYLVTKEKHWSKPTLQPLTQSLQAMKNHNIRNNVTHVCMPKIGCGQDGLQWEKVMDVLRDVYKDTDIEVTVYDYEYNHGAGRMAEDSNSDEHSRQRDDSRSAKIKEKTGDLFTCPGDHSLAHCISADVKMGKGIALTFKQYFGGVKELLDQRQRPGGLAVLYRDQGFIYYLVTKENYWSKPTYRTLFLSLQAMKKHNIENNVTHVSMPKIGCGLDKLQWEVVMDILHDVYKDTDIEITVYHYEDKRGAGRNDGGEHGYAANAHPNKEGGSRDLKHHSQQKQSHQMDDTKNRGDMWRTPQGRGAGSRGDITQYFTPNAGQQRQNDDEKKRVNTANSSQKKEGKARGPKDERNDKRQDNPERKQADHQGKRDGDRSSTSQKKGKEPRDGRSDKRQDNPERKQGDHQGQRDGDTSSTSLQKGKETRDEGTDKRQDNHERKQGDHQGQRDGDTSSTSQQEGKETRDEGTDKNHQCSRDNQGQTNDAEKHHDPSRTTQKQDKESLEIRDNSNDEKQNIDQNKQGDNEKQRDDLEKGAETSSSSQKKEEVQEAANSSKSDAKPHDSHNDEGAEISEDASSASPEKGDKDGQTDTSGKDVRSKSQRKRDRKKLRMKHSGEKRP